MLRPKPRAKRRCDDGLALGSNIGHVVEIVRLHIEAAEQPTHPAKLVGATDADCAVTLAAAALKLGIGYREADVQLRKQRADRLIAGLVHQQRLVVERHLAAKHGGKRRKEAVLHVGLVGERDGGGESGHEASLRTRSATRRGPSIGKDSPEPRGELIPQRNLHRSCLREKAHQPAQGHQLRRDRKSAKNESVGLRRQQQHCS